MNQNLVRESARLAQQYRQYRRLFEAAFTVTAAGLVVMALVAAQLHSLAAAFVIGAVLGIVTGFAVMLVVFLVIGVRELRRRERGGNVTGN